MSQYRIKLSTLAEVYASAKSFLADRPKTDQDALSKLAQLESEFYDTYVNAADEIISKIIEFKHADYKTTSISVASFLDCYYFAYRAGSSLLVDFIFSDTAEIEISYQGLCSIYGEQLVEGVIRNSLHRENGVILVG